MKLSEYKYNMYYCLFNLRIHLHFRKLIPYKYNYYYYGKCSFA